MRREPRRLLPRRWLEPGPGPDDPSLDQRWTAVPRERKRTLLRAARDPAAAERSDDPVMVASLARAQLAQTRRRTAAGVVLGLLVLMTVWGFGRSAAPDADLVFAGMGAVAGVATAVVAVRRARRQRRRAAEVIDRLSHPAA